MLLAGADSLRDVIAFPKTTAQRALFEGAPTPVDRQSDLSRSLHTERSEVATRVTTIDMADDIQQRMSAEGADLLLFAGVNDSNLLELQRTLGVRISFRGDSVTVAGTAEQVERAAPVVQGLIDLARHRRAGHAGRRATGSRPTTPTRRARRSADRRQDRRCPACGGPSRPRRRASGTTSRRSPNHDIVVGIGPAGTGKTYLAVAKAVDALARKRVKRIILARPAVEAGENLGFLPGDLQAKVDPYLRPLYDALEDMMPARPGAARAGDPHDRDRAAGVHARAHAGRRVRHPGRGAERDRRRR